MSAEPQPAEVKQPESRSRMISFRLTVEEYDRFRSLCFARGLHVSEMVRSAVQLLLSREAPAASTDSLSFRVRKLESRVEAIEVRLNLP